MTKYYITPEGKYIGGFDGAEPPANSIEVPVSPKDARMLWNGSQWIDDAAIKPILQEELKEVAIKALGVSSEDMLKSLWERVVNGNDKATDDIAAKIAQAEASIPK